MSTRVAFRFRVRGVFRTSAICSNSTAGRRGLSPKSHPTTTPQQHGPLDGLPEFKAAELNDDSQTTPRRKNCPATAIASTEQVQLGDVWTKLSRLRMNLAKFGQRHQRETGDRKVGATCARKASSVDASPNLGHLDEYCLANCPRLVLCPPRCGRVCISSNPTQTWSISTKMWLRPTTLRFSPLRVMGNARTQPPRSHPHCAMSRRIHCIELPRRVIAQHKVLQQRSLDISRVA